MILTPHQLPISEYHGAGGCPRWWSKTSLMNYKKYGPKWMGLYLQGQIHTERPDGALQGQAIDCYLTEGAEAFAKQWAIKPDGLSLATKEGKAWKLDNDGKEILSHRDNLILCDAVDAVRSCCMWTQIEKSLAQHTIRRDQPALGIGLQARPDWIDTTNGIIFDLKKTRDLDQFGKQAINLGYHLQAALAGFCISGDGIATEHSYLVAVEWSRGARCRVLEIPHEYLIAGHQEMVRLAQEVADHIHREDWSDDVIDHPEMLSAPSYLERKMGQI